MKRTLFALLVVMVSVTLGNAPTQALGECAHSLPPRPGGNVLESRDGTSEVEACVMEAAEDVAVLVANMEERRKATLRAFFPLTYSTECGYGSRETDNARVATLWNHTDLWDLPLDKAGAGLLDALRPGAAAYLTQIQGHTYVVDYRHGAYTWGLVMHDTGIGEITFNKEHFRDATGYVELVCERAGMPPCGAHSHGESMDSDWRMIVRVVLPCPRTMPVPT